MSTVTEIETALKELPLEEAQRLGRWLQRYLDEQSAADSTRTTQASIRLPDYAARRRMVLGDKVLPQARRGRLGEVRERHLRERVREEAADAEGAEGHDQRRAEAPVAVHGERDQREEPRAEGAAHERRERRPYDHRRRITD